MFRLEIETGNAAFADDGASGAIELARILRAISIRIEDGECKGACRDLNGNTVGFFDWTA